jgi:putative tricarboxylic transport membrane protein
MYGYIRQRSVGGRRQTVQEQVNLLLKSSHMRGRDIIGSVFWIIIGLMFCIGALKQGLFSSGEPGPGLLPFLAGAVLVSLGTAVLVAAVGRKGKTSWRHDFFPERNSWKRVGFAVLALVAYVLVWGYLGFLATTFLFVVVLLRFIEPQRWSLVFFAAVLIAVSFYISFQTLLKTHLPGGILGY